MAKQLSEQELQELQSLESELLSNNEERELQELESQYLAQPVDKEVSDYKAQTSSIEAFGRSAAQMVTMDFADEIEAGIDTLTSFIGEKEFTSFEDLSNDYNKNLDISREEFAANKKEHPTADKAGAVAGLAGSLLLPGGAVVKSLKTAGKYGALKTAAKVGAVYGAFGALGRTEDKMSLEGAIEVAEGAAAGAVAGPVFAKGAQLIGKGVNTLVPKGKSLMNRAFKGIGLHTESSRAKFAKSLERKGKDPVKWLKRISKETTVDGKKKIVDNITESFTDILDKTNNKIKHYGVSRDKILDKIKVNISREDLAKKLKAQLSTSKGVSVQDAAYLNNLVDDVVTLKKGVDTKTGALIKIPDESPISPRDLSELRKTLDKSIRFESVSSVHSVKKDLRNSMNNILDDIVASNADEVVALQGKDLRNKMSDLYDLQSALEKGIQREQFGDMAIVQDVISGARGRMMVPGASNTVKDIASTVGIVFRQLAVSPKINRGLSFNMVRLGDAVGNASEASLRRLFSTADGEDVKEFAESVASIIAMSDLSEVPLKRSVDEAIRRKDTILAALQEISPPMASSLREAFESEDREAIGAILDGISKEAKDQIEPGVGFDGKVYSEEDKAFYRSEIQSSRASLAQKLSLMKDLDRTGTIPQIVDDTQPRKQWQPRDKSKPRI